MSTVQCPNLFYFMSLSLIKSEGAVDTVILYASATGLPLATWTPPVISRISESILAPPSLQMLEYLKVPLN